MDSGWAVPTLRPGLRKTVAEKFLTVAMLRGDGVIGGRLGTSPRGVVGTAELSDFMLVRRALFLAAERAGRSIAASTAMRATTMSNSMSVKARWEGNFISHLVGFMTEQFKHSGCHAIFRAKRPISTPQGQK